MPVLRAKDEKDREDHPVWVYAAEVPVYQPCVPEIRGHAAGGVLMRMDEMSPQEVGEFMQEAVANHVAVLRKHSENMLAEQFLEAFTKSILLHGIDDGIAPEMVEDGVRKYKSRILARVAELLKQAGF